MAEVQAEKDLLRAKFAMSIRRLEVTVEQLMNKTTSQVVELSRKDDIISRLKVERDAQEIETITLKTQVEALKLSDAADFPSKNDQPIRALSIVSTCQTLAAGKACR
jgi:hypothetical protein